MNPDFREPKPVENQSGVAREEKDCPICAKYSKGPCGKQFRQWLECTDDLESAVQGTNRLEEQRKKCDEIFRLLYICWEQHERFYDK
jgi:GCK domain